MPFILQDDGTAKDISWDEVDDLKPGVDYYGSLVKLALQHGVQVTAFERELRAEKVYDGKKALDMFPKLPDPVGVRSHYKVAVLDGIYHHPALWPDDAKGRSSVQPEAIMEDDDFSPR